MNLRALSVALRAASYVPAPALLGHVRRRVRSRAIPYFHDRYLRQLERAADQLPRTSISPSQQAVAAASVVAQFFEAKQSKNVPDCFDGRFTFLNRTHDFGGADQIDWRVDMDSGSYQLWRANLSFMGWMCTAFDSDPERSLGFAQSVITSFRSQGRFQRPSDFTDMWNSYPVAQRILALSAILIRLPAEFADRPERGVIDAFLRLNVTYLLGNLETELGYNHLERNLSALALYALAINQMPNAIAAALNRHFNHIVGDTFGDDGVQAERSAMYQALCIQSLRVLSALDLWTSAQAALLARRLAAAQEALAALTLGDDRPIMMNDAWFGETPVTSAVLGHYDVPGFVAMRDAGYVRLAAGNAVAVFDAGPIGPDHNPGHGHADFLSFELSLGKDRFIVDPGTTHYRPDAQRDLERSWHAHNGPCIEGAHPVEYLGSFKVGRRAAAVLGETSASDERQSVEGSLSFDGITVRRRLSLQGRDELVVDDQWSGGNGARSSRFLIPASWQVESSDSTRLRLSQNDRTVDLTAEQGHLMLESSSWTCRYNECAPAHAITLTPDGDAARLTFRWS